MNRPRIVAKDYSVQYSYTHKRKFHYRSIISTDSFLLKYNYMIMVSFVCDENSCCMFSFIANEWFFQDNSYLTKQAPSDIWSKWSKWSSCSHNCRTYRIRRCKKPGRCNKQIQDEQAYCYHDNTVCQLYVINLVENNRQDYYGKSYFLFSNEGLRKIR